jgi:hypothetical protein
MVRESTEDKIARAFGEMSEEQMPKRMLKGDYSPEGKDNHV